MTNMQTSNQRIWKGWSIRKPSVDDLSSYVKRTHLWRPFFTLAFMFMCVMPAKPETQEFKVRVLDALNGKPYQNMRVTYGCEDQMFDPSMVVMTGVDGFVVVPYRCGIGVKIKIGTWIGAGSEWAGKVEECGDLQAQSLRTILDVGVISEPTAAGGIWCPAKVSKKLKPIPGQIIIFVKKPTWWQTHIAP